MYQANESEETIKISQLYDQQSICPLLVIDDNESIHRDFAKVLLPPQADHELEELNNNLFGEEPDSKDEDVSLKFEIDSAFKGKEGFELLKSSLAKGRTYGAAFVDMRMPPGWDGVKTIEHLWQVDPDLQVVICTAYSDRSWDEIIQKFGCTDKLVILKKPFDDIEVVQLATSLSVKRRLLDESRNRLKQLKKDVNSKNVKLRSANQDAEVLLSSISSAIISLDRYGIVTRWNHSAETLFELNSFKAIGEDFCSLPIRWVDSEKVHGLMQNGSLLQQEQVVLEFTCKMGTKRSLDASVSPILNEVASKARMIVANDVTEQRRLQSQLKNTSWQESLDQFSANIAREIHRPINKIDDSVRFASKAIENLVPLLDCLAQLANENLNEEEFDDLRKLMMQRFTPSEIEAELRKVPAALIDAEESVASVNELIEKMRTPSEEPESSDKPNNKRLDLGQVDSIAPSAENGTGVPLI